MARAGAAVLAGFLFVDPAGAQAEPGSAPAAKAAEPQKLDIYEFIVDGNTVLDEDLIYAALQGYTGPGRVVADVDAARAALEKAYRDQGYKTVTVAIPKQTVRDGAVALLVNEGRVGHLNVIGSRYHSIDHIRQDAPSLAEGRVPDFDEVKKDLIALNQQADRRVTPSLKAGAAPGTVDIDLVVSDELPLHGSLELNNRRSQDTTALRSIASLSYDNLWQRGHSLSLSYQTAPENTDDARVWFGSYLFRFGNSPFNLLLSGLKSDSDVATVGGIAVVGRGETAGVRAVWTLPGQERLYQSITAGLDYKHFRNQVVVEDSSYETPVTYYPFSLAYSVMQQGERGASTQGDLSFNFASPELGSDTEELDLNRYLARGQQFSLRGALARTQPLWWGMEGYARLSAQWSDQPLITNEQIAAGGADSVRGYYEAETLGDYGLVQNLELRTPSLANALSLGSLRPFQQFQFHVFADGTVVRVHDPLPGSAIGEELLSAGAGLNLQMLHYLNGSVSWAFPLRDGPATQGGEGRVLFRVWGSF